MYELNVDVTAESSAPPDFILYAIVNYPGVLLEISGNKFNYRKHEDTHILKRFGLTTEIKIMPSTKITRNHYLLTLFIKTKLPLIYESGIGKYHFISDGEKTVCFGGGSETFKGLSGIIVHLSEKRIKKHFKKMWNECIENVTRLWIEPEIAENYLPEDIAKKIKNRESFDSLLRFKTEGQVDIIPIEGVSIGLPSGSKKIVIQSPKKLCKHDVFLCHSSKDIKIINETCKYLESKDIKCWIATRDIRAGAEYHEAIIDAINESQIMILILSANSNKSPHVIRELNEAVSSSVHIIPFQIGDVSLSKPMKYLIGIPHWLDAMTPPIEQHFEKLVETICQFLNNETVEDEA